MIWDVFGFMKNKQQESFKSKRFNILVDSGVNKDDVLQTIKSPFPDKIDASLEDYLDGIYYKVESILDIRVSRFKCNIRFMRNPEALYDLSKKLFGRSIKTGGFYVTGFNEIYVDSENCTFYILAHEIAHALLVDYFTVPPSVIIQEVLAGYVEHKLRRGA